MDATKVLFSKSLYKLLGESLVPDTINEIAKYLNPITQLMVIYTDKDNPPSFQVSQELYIKQLIDYSFDYNDSLFNAISNVANVVSVSPHIESFALASSGSLTKGVAVLAIDPEKELVNLGARFRIEIAGRLVGEE